jgi:REP element-mobilizing transposase RayT
MPDHVHVLLHALSEQSDFTKCAKHFKQMTGFHLRKEHHVRVWQPGYYERILRDDEQSEAVIRYILENPIRAGIARELGEYPYAGSDEYDLEELRTAWSTVKAAKWSWM